MLVDRLAEDPVVGLAAPRPDFEGALQEFLIGLLAAALHPEDEREWRRLWKAPPTAETLRTALEALPAALQAEGRK